MPHLVPAAGLNAVLCSSVIAAAAIEDQDSQKVFNHAALWGFARIAIVDKYFTEASIAKRWETRTLTARIMAANQLESWPACARFPCPPANQL